MAALTKLQKKQRELHKHIEICPTCNFSKNLCPIGQTIYDIWKEMKSGAV